MPESITLTGITWNHTRGYIPMEATAQRFMDESPHVSISWEKRSLKDFGDFPIQRLTEKFDLLIIDHPFAGYAALHPVLVTLDLHLSPDYLSDQAQHSVGISYQSYVEDGHLWALPVDAAAPISGYRPDLLAKHGESIPTSWDDLLSLARKGLVVLPATAVDSLMNFYMLCLGQNDDLFQGMEEIVPRETGVNALLLLKEVVSLAGLENLDRNPIRTWEALARGDRYAYCPFAYGYSNYGRADFTANRLQFGGLVSLNGKRLRSTIGGTGLAISARCKSIPTAIEYAAFVASHECQRGLYTLTGGQPGHRAAWEDEYNNQLTNGFFTDTLQTLDESYLRPRYSGYIPFQDQAGEVVREFLRGRSDPAATVEEINRLYRTSRGNG